MGQSLTLWPWNGSESYPATLKWVRALPYDPQMGQSLTPWPSNGSVLSCDPEMGQSHENMSDHIKLSIGDGYAELQTSRLNCIRENANIPSFFSLFLWPIISKK